MANPALCKNVNEEHGNKLFVQIWIIALMIVGAVIRIYGANDYYYNPDEAFHASIAHGETVAKILHYSLQETHPPLFYIVLHYWMKLSDEPWFVRGFSLFALLLIPLNYRIGTLLNDRVTGICAATLMTFSSGTIIHFYLVRHYALCLIFLSLCFYFYLLWRKKHKEKHLLAYCVFGLLACFTYFFALLGIFSLALYELAALYRQKVNARRMFVWMGVNAAIALPSLTMMYIWRHALTAWNPGISESLMTVTARYPVMLAGIVLPSTFFVALVFLLPKMLESEKLILPFLRLCMVAFGVGLLQNSVDPGQRHHLWLIPFLIPFFGWIMGWGITHLARLHSVFICGAAAFALCFTGSIFHQRYPVRMAEYGSEYALQEQYRQPLMHYLQQLDEHDLVIASRTNIFMLNTPTNPYEYIDSYGNPPVAAVMPYYKTNVVFHPAYGEVDLAQLLRDGQLQPLLAKANNLVFLTLPWAELPINNLVTCPALDKKIITFPSSAHEPTAPELSQIPVILLTVPKKEFIEQVLNPTGKAHPCLEGP